MNRSLKRLAALRWSQTRLDVRRISELIANRAKRLGCVDAGGGEEIEPSIVFLSARRTVVGRQ